ncbi:thioredoxin-like protein [Zopfochytrium polystomum]|nr:thioredoxin-like protein [Zopfochytrium polystomum]
MEEQRREAAAANSAAGKPQIGGPFILVDQTGRPVTNLDYLGKYVLMYFGYTFCPDVCPEELEKMAKVVVPVFISCDPKRDSLKAIGEYVKEFHSDFVALTGTYEQIKRVAKAYRLYFSAPPRALDDDDTDYLVDHSIFFYLVDPNGKYCAHFGRQETAESVAAKIEEIAIDSRGN